jgi:hypothetical protein
MARQIGFPAACPEGKGPRASMAFPIARSRLSMAFVVQITRLISGLNAKKGITSSRARRHARAIEGDWPPRASSKASSASRASFASLALWTAFDEAATDFRPFRERNAGEWRTRRTTQVCAVICGKAAVIASGKPFKPSTTAIRMSATSRLRGSFMIPSRNFAPSSPAIQRPDRALALGGDPRCQVDGLVIDDPTVLVADPRP